MTAKVHKAKKKIHQREHMRRVGEQMKWELVAYVTREMLKSGDMRVVTNKGA